MKRQYKYSLEKSGTIPGHIGNKHICPNCGHKTFVRYVDNETGQYLNENVGKCDRLDKCAYHYPPRSFFKDNPGITAKKTNAIPNLNKKIKIMKQQLCTLEMQLVTDSLSFGSNFTMFLRRTFAARIDAVESSIRMYNIGGTDESETIFWQIDRDGRVRGGKIMKYDEYSGKRVKDMDNAVTWIHSRLQSVGVIPRDWRLTQCLFGEHLINGGNNKTIVVVESEKTAVIASIFYPQYIWLATGGKMNLKENNCECLANKNVMFLPDLNAYDDWVVRAQKVSEAIGFKYVVISDLESRASGGDREEGLDIADYLIFRSNEELNRK